MISVVLPFRDASSTLRTALESVLAEPCVAEVITVDDGSVDASRGVVEDLARRDARVRIVATGGVGVARALASGVAASRGEFVARMDADDVSHPNRITRAAAALEAEPALSAVGTQVESPSPSEGLAAYLAWQNALVTPEAIRRDVFVEAPLCHPSVTLRRAALEAVGGYREAPWAEDWDLWLRLVTAGHALGKIPEVLFTWTQRPGRVTSSDPRCSQRAFTAARAAYLPRALPRDRPTWIWGAGKAGRSLARELEPRGVAVAGFVDIDPAKIGRRARGAPIVAPDALPREAFTLVCVAARGARDVVVRRLAGAGREPGRDFLAAS